MHLVRYVRQQRYLSGSLDRYHQTPLMLCADSCSPARKDFAALGQVSLDFSGIFIVDILSSVDTKLAYFPTFPAMWFVISIVRHLTPP